MDIVSLHRLDFLNPGDLWSSPLKYLPIQGRVFDIAAKPEELSCDLLIVGGGAIISHRDPWRGWLEGWIERISYQKAVIWGADVTPKMRNLPIIAKFDLIGARNIDSSFRFVPCASCLHPVFDENPKGEGIGIISHKRRIIPNEDIVNAPNDFETVVKFIKMHSTIVSASYHAVYWSILLNRRVYIYDSPEYDKKLPSKMRTFELQPPIVSDLVIANSETYEFQRKNEQEPGPPLARYRRLNSDFGASVFGLFNKKSPLLGGGAN